MYPEHVGALNLIELQRALIVAGLGPRRGGRRAETR